MAKALDDKDQQLQNTQPQILKLESLRGQDEVSAVCARLSVYSIRSRFIHNPGP